MKHLGISLLLCMFSSSALAAECPAPGSTVELFGTIGKNLFISMNLTSQRDHLSGSYFYVKFEKKIALAGTCDAGSVSLQESDPSGKPSGTFRGTFRKPQIVDGTWSTADGKKALPFQLQALLPSDHVSGKYRSAGYDLKKRGAGEELNILLLENGELRIQGTALYVTVTQYANTGEADGITKLEGDTAHFVEDPDNKDSCRFTIHFSNRSITVSDDNNACGGMNVSFNDTYGRVGPPTIDESLNAPH